MPHPNGGDSFFDPKHTFNEAYEFVKNGYRKFDSTTGENISASIGLTKDKRYKTIVYIGEKCRHGNVCSNCWGYRINCQGARIGQCSKALDEYMSQKNPERIKDSTQNLLVEKKLLDNGVTESLSERKRKYIVQYKKSIIDWITDKIEAVIRARQNYKWKNKSNLQCVKERNEVSKAIVNSRIKNYGGVDIETLDRVMKWGFNQSFPDRDATKVLEQTTKAFDELDKGNLIEATIILLKFDGVGISRVSKILGLFDQDNLCVYDSRVGSALSDLRYNSEKLIKCPTGRNKSGDSMSDQYGWATEYQKLIWTLEIMNDYINEKGYTFRLADVEMGLFMMGK